MIFISEENGSSFLIKIVLATIIQSMQRYRIRGKGDSIYDELSLTTAQGQTVPESFKAYQNLDMVDLLIVCLGFYAVLVKSKPCNGGLRYAVNETFSKET